MKLVYNLCALQGARALGVLISRIKPPGFRRILALALLLMRILGLSLEHLCDDMCVSEVIYLNICTPPGF